VSLVSPSDVSGSLKKRHKDVNDLRAKVTVTSWSGVEVVGVKQESNTPCVLNPGTGFITPLEYDVD